MYSYLHFAIALFGLFSIIENIKGRQKITLLKTHIIFLLSIITLSSSFEFLMELGYDMGFYSSISRLFGLLAITNLFFIVALSRIPKFVILIELLFFILYLVMILNNVSYTFFKQGYYNTETTQFQKFHFLVTTILVLVSMTYNLFIIFSKKDNNNLYNEKINRWSRYLSITLIFLIIYLLAAFILFKNDIRSVYVDTRFMHIIARFTMLVFILFRPKLIDEADFSTSVINLKYNKASISALNFDFLFYNNHYFLNREAHLEDFALKLNHSEKEVVDFIKTQTSDNFNELINRNRIKYFKELLNSGKHESFTIEALSEMSGYNNRQSMYNAFRKYENCSPSDYISTL